MDYVLEALPSQIGPIPSSRSELIKQAPNQDAFFFGFLIAGFPIGANIRRPRPAFRACQVNPLANKLIDALVHLAIKIIERR